MHMNFVSRALVEKSPRALVVFRIPVNGAYTEDLSIALPLHTGEGNNIICFLLDRTNATATETYMLANTIDPKWYSINGTHRVVTASARVGAYGPLVIPAGVLSTNITRELVVMRTEVGVGRSSGTSLSSFASSTEGFRLVRRNASSTSSMLTWILDDGAMHSFPGRVAGGDTLVTAISGTAMTVPSADAPHVAFSFFNRNGLVETGSYTGTGAANRTVELGFKPELMLIADVVNSTSRRVYLVNFVDSNGNEVGVVDSLSYNDSRTPDSSAVMRSGTGFTLKTGSPLNVSGRTYRYYIVKAQSDTDPGYRYWRLRNIQATGTTAMASYVGLSAEVATASSFTGATTITASSQANTTSYAASNAILLSSTSFWRSTASSAGHTLTLEYAKPIKPKSLNLRSPSISATGTPDMTQMPRSFILEASRNNSLWEEKGTFETPAWSASGVESRYFDIPW